MTAFLLVVVYLLVITPLAVFVGRFLGCAERDRRQERRQVRADINAMSKWDEAK